MISSKITFWLCFSIEKKSNINKQKNHPKIPNQEVQEDYHRG